MQKQFFGERLWKQQDHAKLTMLIYFLGAYQRYAKYIHKQYAFFMQHICTICTIKIYKYAFTNNNIHLQNEKRIIYILRNI